MLNAVVLPAPFGPMMPTISHSPIVIVTSEFARTPPKAMLAWLTSSTDIGDEHLPQSAVLDVELVSQEPLGDRTDLLADAAREQREGEQQQQGAEDERGSARGQRGAGQPVQSRLHAGDVLDEVADQREHRRPDHDPRTALQSADDGHDD